jgi:hypothetical protein
LGCGLRGIVFLAASKSLGRQVGLSNDNLNGRAANPNSGGPAGAVPACERASPVPGGWIPPLTRSGPAPRVKRPRPTCGEVANVYEIRGDSTQYDH